MNRRRTFLTAAGLLAAPGVALAFWPRPYPPQRWAGPPVVQLVPVYPCPAPVFVTPDCPPPAGPSARPLDPPKVMEKPEAPPPKVKPTAASEPVADKPKVELATPTPAVPAEPLPDKPKAEEPAPLRIPPQNPLPTKPKEEEPAAKPTPPPGLALPPFNTDKPKKPDELTIPPLTLPKTSESKYTPAAGPTVRVVPVDGRRSAGNQTVSFYNYTERPLSLRVDGKETQLPARSLVSLALPDSFKWTLGDKTETATVPTDAAGLSVVIQ